MTGKFCNAILQILVLQLLKVIKSEGATLDRDSHRYLKDCAFTCIVNCDIWTLSTLWSKKLSALFMSLQFLRMRTNFS